MDKDSKLALQYKMLQQDEIDLLSLARTLWNGRSTILKAVVISFFIGVFVALVTKDEFTASTTIVVQNGGEKTSGTLGGLAAIAGINLSGENDGNYVSPLIYKEILTSVAFKKALIKTPLTIKGQPSKVSFEEYYTKIKKPSVLDYIKKYTIGLPGMLLKALKPKKTPFTGNGQKLEVLTITKNEQRLFSIIKANLTLDLNEDDGYIRLNGTMPEPVAVAEFTQAAQKLLQQFVIDFKIQKSKEKLAFIEARYQEKKDWFDKTERNLALYLDKNKFITTSLAQTELKRLEAQYELAFGVYSELAKQWETAQIQVTEDTPVFTVVTPAYVPLEKSNLGKAKIVMVFLILGIVAGISLIAGKKGMQLLISKWQEAQKA